MKRYRLNPKKPRKLTAAETRKLDATPIDYSDIPALTDEFFRKATAAWPINKQQLTIRLDADVVAWLKSTGEAIRPAAIEFCAALWRISHAAECFRSVPRGM